MTDQSKITNGNILVADNDPGFSGAFSQMLKIHNYRVAVTNNRSEVVSLAAAGDFDLLTLDLDWGDSPRDGIEILREINTAVPRLPVIILTEHASIPTAVEATRLGAIDYLEKMHDREKSLLAVKNAVEIGRLKKQNRAAVDDLLAKYELIGESREIAGLREQILRIAPTDSVVLITGESGTGKELAARQVHLHSRRALMKFVPVDSGTLADNLIESELFGYLSLIHI